MNGSAAAIFGQNWVLGGGAPVALNSFDWPSSSGITASSICFATFFRCGALVRRQQAVGIGAPHPTEPAEPAVVHPHAADIAELDLAVRLQLLAHGDKLLQRLWHFLGLDEVGTVEEHAKSLAHRHHGVL